MSELIKRRRYRIDERVTDEGNVELQMPALGLSATGATKMLANRRLRTKVKKAKDEMLDGTREVVDSDADPDLNYVIIDLYRDRASG